jgi:hypothetical protein
MESSSQIRHASRHRPEALDARPIVEKNITLRGFNLQGSFQHFERALAQIFDWAKSGRLKVEMRKYPLRGSRRAGAKSPETVSAQPHHLCAPVPVEREIAGAVSDARMRRAAVGRPAVQAID